MMVKVCGITNQADADAAAGAGAIGFNFYAPSPRYLSPAEAGQIETAAGVLRVGVFVNEPRAAEIAREARLDVVQLHGDELMGPGGFRVWKAYRVTDEFSIEKLAFQAEAFLLDAPSELYGGSGQPFDWKRAQGGERKILLAGGLGPENIQEAIRTARPWGVDACSRLELRPGIKDHERVARFIELALTA